MNGVPSNEIIWTQIKSKSGTQYLITSKEIRDVYHIYKVERNKAERLGKGKNPLDLEEQYIE